MRKNANGKLSSILLGKKWNGKRKEILTFRKINTGKINQKTK